MGTQHTPGWGEGRREERTSPGERQGAAHATGAVLRHVHRLGAAPAARRWYMHTARPAAAHGGTAAGAERERGGTSC